MPSSINVMAPINPLGYGVVGLNITKELSVIAEVSLLGISAEKLSPNTKSLDINPNP